jgi:Site-specific recombinase XerD
VDPDLNLSIDQAIADYLGDCRRRGLRPATLRAYADALRRLRRTLPADAPVASLTLAAGRAWQDEATSRLSPGSVAGYTQAIRVFGRWCAAEEIVDRDPFVRLRCPRFDHRVLTVPTDAQLRALFASASPTMRVVLAFLVGAGLRIGELCSLKLADFSYDRVLLRSTKNRRDRFVLLDSVLAELLTRYVRDLRPTGGPGCRTVFVTRLGTPLTPDAVRRNLRRTAIRAGVYGIRVSPHTMRHWFARDGAAHGTDPRVIAAQAGWRDSRMLDRYAPVAEAHIMTELDRYSAGGRLADAGILGIPASALRRHAVEGASGAPPRIGRPARP